MIDCIRTHFCRPAIVHPVCFSAFDAKCCMILCRSVMYNVLLHKTHIDMLPKGSCVQQPQQIRQQFYILLTSCKQTDFASPGFCCCP